MAPPQASQKIPTPPRRPEAFQDRYLLPVPLGPSGMDLFHLDSTIPEQALALVAPLLRGEGLDRAFALSGRWNPLWSSWATDNRNAMHHRGYRPLGLGFPLVYLRDAKALTVAPLFIWSIDIRPDPLRVDYWRVRYPKGLPPLVNPELLRSGRLKAEPFQSSSWHRQLLENDSGWSALRRLCQQAGLDWHGEGRSIRPVWGTREEEHPPELPEEGVQPSGLLTLFPPPEPWAALAGPLPQPEERAATGPVWGPFALRPQEAKARNAFERQSLLTVCGPRGSGKTRLLIDRLVRAMADGKRCLFLSPRPETLRALHQYLRRLGLEDLVVLAPDPLELDGHLQARLQDLPRADQEVEASDAPPFPEEEACLEQLEPLQQARQALSEPVFGPHRWTEVVSMYLRAVHHPESIRLEPSFSGELPNYSWEAYQELHQLVARGQHLYRPLGTLNHPLTHLRQNLFVEYDLVACETYLQSQLTEHIEAFSGLRAAYLQAQEDYRNRLETHYADWYRSLAVPLADLQDLIDTYTQEHGNDFALSSLTSLRLIGWLLGKYRGLYEVKKQVFEAYQGLALRYGEYAYFPFSFPEFKRGNELPKLRATLAELEEALEQWYGSIPAQVEDAVGGLSSRNLHPAVPMEDTLLEIEDGFAEASRQLHATRLFPNPPHIELAKESQAAEAFDRALQPLQMVQEGMVSFEPFYKWQRFVLELDRPLRTLIETLAAKDPGSWSASFDRWFLAAWLARHENRFLPGPGWSPDGFAQAWASWHEALPGQLLTQWSRRRQAILHARRPAKAGNRSLLRMPRMGKAPEGEAQPWRPADTTGLFPAWLMTPQSVAAWWSSPIDGPPPFDELFIDDAHDLAWSAAAGFFGLAAHRLVAGRSMDATRMGSETLIHHLLSADYPAEFLEEEHVNGSKEPAAAATRMRRLPGLFHPQDHTNEAEVDALIEHLIEIDRAGAPGEVAIIAWLPAQRDRIVKRLQISLARELPEATSIARLMDGGLHVYHLGESTDLSADHIVYSITFGPESEDGPPGESLLSLDQPDWVDLQAIAFQRPCSSRYILTSLPSDWDPEDGAGRQALHAWLKQAETKPRERPQVREASPEVEPVAPPFFPPSALSEILAERMAEHLQPSTEDSHPAHRPLVLKSPGESDAPAYCLLDGTLAPIATTDFVWESQMKDRLEQQGAVCLPVWSRQLWRDPKGYLEKLLRNVPAARNSDSPPDPKT